MGIVDLAAQRLEELRRSGIEVPQRGETAVPAPAPPVAREGLPVLAARRIEEARSREAPTARKEARVQPSPADPVPARTPAMEDRAGEGTGKTVEIDLGRLNAMGYLTSFTPHAQIAHDFRVIKRELLTNASDGATKNGNLIMVTSALPNEGKTFVAINLAISMAAEVDRRILLVDADVARPSLLPRLGLPPTRGFLDALVDPSVALNDLLLRTNIDKLTILPAGAPRAHATEMLASESMGRLMNELATRYSDRVIVFDAPPLLPSTESRVLATRMGQVILVVEARQTPKKAVEQALATVESCPLVLPLLNKASHSEVGYYYGYYGLEPG